LSTWKYEEWLDDGYFVHAPVGSYRANGYGLHDTIGNVYEWCRDWHGPYGNAAAAGDGERKVLKTRNRVYRGASWGSPASCSRSAYRYFGTPKASGSHLGVRPVRTIHR
jgi:formylglycine-generating enzyme required for sulfatase activity